jgi:5,6-dimethylbenzimidazole synthase
MVSFDESFRRQLHELFVWRRDVRRFRSDPLPEGALERLIEIACLSPSVGLSQPWRFVIVEDEARRHAVIDDFRSCNADALRSYSGERAARYAGLKLAGLEEAPGHLAVFAEKACETGHGLGRATMPEMIEYSVVAAICSMWLAARAEGIGLGWVSILSPTCIQEILRVPESWKFIGYLCIGYPQAEFDHPELERANWEYRRSSTEFTTRR